MSQLSAFCSENTNRDQGLWGSQAKLLALSLSLRIVEASGDPKNGGYFYKGTSLAIERSNIGQGIQGRGLNYIFYFKVRKLFLFFYIKHYYYKSYCILYTISFYSSKDKVMKIYYNISLY